MRTLIGKVSVELLILLTTQSPRGFKTVCQQPRLGWDLVSYTPWMPRIEYVKLFVNDYDRAIGFFQEVLGFDLVEDLPSLSNDGTPKRWVVVRPRNSETGLLLTIPRNADQIRACGAQTSDRSGFFLRVENFDESYAKLVRNNVEIVHPPTKEAYGFYAMFKDISGNVWDLLGPKPSGIDT